MRIPHVRKIPINDGRSKSSPKIAGFLANIHNPTPSEIKLLARWRRRNTLWFRDTKPITFKGTQIWWQGVQNNPLRILFWVQNSKGNKIGHMGLNRFKNKSCELDNVIRGRKASPGLMGFAAKSLINWVFKSLPIEKIYLQTNFDNLHAIKFYQKCGFKIVKKSRPLIKMRYFPQTARV